MSSISLSNSNIPESNFRRLTPYQFDGLLNRGLEGIKKLEPLGAICIDGDVNIPQEITRLPVISIIYSDNVTLNECEIERFKGVVKGDFNVSGGKLKHIDEGANIDGITELRDCDIEYINCEMNNSLDIINCPNIKELYTNGKIKNLYICASRIENLKCCVEKDIYLDKQSLIYNMVEGTEIGGDLCVDNSNIVSCSCDVGGSASFINGGKIQDINIDVKGDLDLNDSSIEYVRCNVRGKFFARKTENLIRIDYRSSFGVLFRWCVG